jgi:hypothetical protein
MDDFEEKLNSILGNPAEMEKIMNLARSLSGDSKPSDDPAVQEPDPSSAPLPGLDKIDGKTLRLITRLMGEYSSKDDGKAQLLTAMKPYLKPERQAALDRAAEITKITRLAKIAFKELGGGGNV